MLRVASRKRSGDVASLILSPCLRPQRLDGSADTRHSPTFSLSTF